MSRKSSHNQKQSPRSSKYFEIISVLPIRGSVIYFLFLFTVLIGSGGTRTYAQSPNDGLIINNYVPFETCDGLDEVHCTFSINDTKTNFTTGAIATLQHTVGQGILVFSGDLDAASPGPCFVWLLTCTKQLDYAHFHGTNTVTLPVPTSGLQPNGMTFRLKIFNQNRTSATQQGTIAGMLNTWSMDTIGPRWAMHTAQKAPDGTGSGHELSPWEPNTYTGNVHLYEDVYFTFTNDGRVRIDKFTPYFTGFWWTTTHYIWEESLNDGGWPVQWTTTGQSFFNLNTLFLGGQADPSTVDNSGTDQFRQLSVYKASLTTDQMIQEENFDLNAGAELAEGMSPCNTGNWVNTSTIQTPCGGGGNGQPVPAPPTNVSGYSASVENFAPQFTATDNGGKFIFNWAPPPAGPDTPVNYTMYFDIVATNGQFDCSISGFSAADLNAWVALENSSGVTVVPDATIVQAALGANYSDSTLNGPNGRGTTSWLNPNPVTSSLSFTPSDGESCTQVQ